MPRVIESGPRHRRCASNGSRGVASVTSVSASGDAYAARREQPDTLRDSDHGGRRSDSAGPLTHPSIPARRWKAMRAKRYERIRVVTDDARSAPRDLLFALRRRVPTPIER